jgi:hypothetical protein
VAAESLLLTDVALLDRAPRRLVINAARVAASTRTDTTLHGA